MLAVPRGEPHVVRGWECGAAPRILNRLPFLVPVLAVGYPLDNPDGPWNQLKKSQKAGGVPKWHIICANLADIECKRYT